MEIGSARAIAQASSGWRLSSNRAENPAKTCTN